MSELMKLGRSLEIISHFEKMVNQGVIISEKAQGILAAQKDGILRNIELLKAILEDSQEHPE